MTVLYALLIVAVTIAFVILLVRILLNDSQPTWRETLLKHCEEQHAALARGDLQLWIYGNYPPVPL